MDDEEIKKTSASLIILQLKSAHVIYDTRYYRGTAVIGGCDRFILGVFIVKTNLKPCHQQDADQACMSLCSCCVCVCVSENMTHSGVRTAGLPTSCSVNVTYTLGVTESRTQV